MYDLAASHDGLTPRGAVAAPRPQTSTAARFAHVILNPAAGAGRAGRLQPRLVSAMARRFGRNHTLHVTERPGDATVSAAAAVAAGATLVVAVGGDGTIHETVNGLLRSSRPRGTACALGIVDCGTGRGLATSLGLPETLDAQLDLLASPHTAAIDVGHVACWDAAAHPVNRWFVSECQMGIGGAIVADLRTWHKRFGGRVAFGAVALLRALRHAGTAFSVTYGCGSSATTRPLLGLAIGNGSVCAAGMRLTPDALPNDGLFDVLAIHDMPKPTRLGNFPRVYTGTHIHSPHFSVRRANHVMVSAVPPAPVAADGELIGHTPAILTLLPSALPVRCDGLPGG